jgi:hypothetical protein
MITACTQQPWMHACTVLILQPPVRYNSLHAAALLLHPSSFPADRLKKMAIKPSNSGGSSGDKAAPAAAARPGRQAARAAAATYSFAESDEDEDADDAASSDGDCSSDPDEVMSPAPELLKAKAKPRTAAAAAGKSKAAAATAAPLPPKPMSPAPRVAFGRTMSSSESPLVEKKAAPKRKPRGEYCSG